MKDKELRRVVTEALEYEPSIDAADVGVLAEDGVITLTGHVPTYSQKIAAETACWRVKGVKAVVQHIEVRPSDDPGTDEAIAKCATRVLRWDSTIPKDSLRITVNGGWLTLEGEVTFQFQRANAELDVRNLKGLTGISNNLRIRPGVAATGDVKLRIEEALRRTAEAEARGIEVHVEGGEVVLKGSVGSWAERQAIEQAAWAAPGVFAVDDRIVIATRGVG